MDAAYLNDLKDGYFAKDGFVKEGFMCTYSEAIANEFAETGLSNKQARNFFNRVNQYALLNKRKIMDIREARANLLWLISLAFDKQKKGTNPGCFKTFLEKNVEAIHTDQDLAIFKIHFETICNYMPEKKENGPSNNTQGNSGKSQGGYHKPNNGYNGNRQGNGGNNFSWKTR